jgi:uncharacterized damage-inducible protein DinB
MTGEDRSILQGMLAWQRATLLNVCAGLTANQLAARPVPTTQLSLLGLVRHLAKVERIWLRQRVAGQDLPGLYGWPVNGADFGEVDASRAQQDVEQLHREWQLADIAVSTVPLTHEIEVRGDVMSLRMVYLHLISEYARHNGHADLLREALDGVTAR